MEYILGIESTAHTFGIALLTLEKNPRILVNTKDSYSTEKGGMIPLEVATHHREIADQLYKKMFRLVEAEHDVKIDEKEIKAIAFSNAPGLAPCLIEGMKFAKKLSKKLQIPLIPVNHCIAHLEIGELTGAKDPVLLYASGANTQIIAYEAGKYRIFGETLDIGVGNFIDTFARYAGLGFPGGPAIQKIAEKGKKYIELPYTIKGMDVAFSGLLTKLRRMLESNEYKLEDLSFSLQETIFAMLVESAERALAHTGKTELLLGGGVACNTRLQEMCKLMCKQRGASFFVPENSLLVDNAAMIAYLGIKMFKKKIYAKPSQIDKVDIQPRQRTDDVLVRWK
jgi:N6-L-threonylcarbamoyladenine synthase